MAQVPRDGSKGRRRIGRRPPGTRGAWARLQDMPIRWKILLPFAFLALTYGFSGTYIFTRGTAAEARAERIEQLRGVSAVVTAEFENRRTRLTQLVRHVARTEGVPEAIGRRDVNTLRRLAVPTIANAGASLFAVVDAAGASLLDVRTDDRGVPSFGGRRTWDGVPLVADVRRRAIGELPADIVRIDNESFLAVAATIDRAGGALVLSGYEMSDILAGLTRLTGARLGVIDTAGSPLAGLTSGGTPTDAPAGLRTRRSIEGRSFDAFSAPIVFGDRQSGTLVIALPAVSGFGALGEQAWKIAFLAIAALGGVFLLGFGVARWISHPLDQLVGSTDALRRGTLHHRTNILRSDEVGRLARSFNEMAEQLEESHTELEHRVEDRTRRLEEALERLDRTNAELARASEAKSAFLADMSHELRTPLSTVMMGAEMLQGSSDDGFDARMVRDLAGRILRNAKHLLALIEDLLDLSRIEAGRLELQVESVELSTLLCEAAETIAPMARKKGVRLDIPEAEGRRVQGDPLRIRQVLLNLLTNALKFTPAKGKVWIDVGMNAEAAVISVHDTGIGIRPEDLERIFDPFVQVSPSERRGAGLGLAISRRITELHGGSLTATSTPGTGSTFILVLPRVRGARTRGARPRRPLVRRTAARKRATVLLVEDESDVAELTERVLRGGKFDVRRAATVRTAVDAFDETHPDLVLLDVRLGDEDGLEIARYVSGLDAPMRVPVVALSANATGAEVERGLEAGCAGYLVKPVAADELISQVRSFLDTARRRRPRAPAHSRSSDSTRR